MPEKKIIVFGTNAQVKGIGGILRKNGVEVTEVPAVDSYKPLTDAIKRHQDADLVILCGTPLNNQVLYATQEARRLTKSPILVVMSQCRITTPSKEKVLQAGATEVRYSPNHIEDEQVVLAAAKMLGISLRLERKEDPPPPPPPSQVAQRPPQQSPPQLRVVPQAQTPPVVSDPEPVQTEPVSATVSTTPAQTVDQKAAAMLDLAVRLETNAKLLREWAEEMLASMKQQQEQVPQPELAPVNPLLAVGQMVAKGRMVTLCGVTLHLPHQHVKALEVLFNCRNNGGAGKDLFHRIGIKTPGAVSVAMSALRKRLKKVLPGAGIYCKAGKYHLELPS